MTYRSEMLLTEMSFVKETKSSSTDAFEKFQIYSSVNTISRHVCCVSLLTCGSEIKENVLCFTDQFSNRLGDFWFISELR